MSLETCAWASIRPGSSVRPPRSIAPGGGVPSALPTSLMRSASILTIACSSGPAPVPSIRRAFQRMVTRAPHRFGGKQPRRARRLGHQRARGDQRSDPLDVVGERSILGDLGHDLGHHSERVLKRRGQLAPGQIVRLAQRHQLVGKAPAPDRRGSARAGARPGSCAPGSPPDRWRHRRRGSKPAMRASPPRRRARSPACAGSPARSAGPARVRAARAGRRTASRAGGAVASRRG